MPRVAVIGERVRVEGFALAGALVLAADTPGEARAAWDSLPPEVAVAVLTHRAAAWLRAPVAERPGVLTVEMPP